MSTKVDLTEDFFIEFADSFSDVDWYYDYTDDHKQWLKLSDEFRRAMIRLKPLSENDLEKFINLKVPNQMKNSVRDEVSKINGTYSDDFKYRKLT